MAKYTLVQLAYFLGLVAEHNVPVGGVCVDSRLAKAGDLFFALPGARVDGHAYIGEAVARGAVAAVVARGYEGDSFGVPLLHVPNTLQALQSIAKTLLAIHKPKIAAVTGSMGKTTVKDFILQLAKGSMRTAATPGSYNSQIGLPLTIINGTDGREELLVLEMGMTHAGNIAELVSIAPPDVALITATALVHACNFSDVAAIGRGKAEIFSSSKTRLGLLSRSIVNLEELRAVGRCRKETFAVEDAGADYSMEILEGKLVVKKGRDRVELPPLEVPGKHNRHNLLAAVAVARSVGVDWEAIIEAIPTLKLPERRLQFIEREGILFVNDAYNANPMAVKAALDSLPSPKEEGRRVAVLGEMMELGEMAAALHREVGEYALGKVDMMFCFGELTRNIDDVWTAAGRKAYWAPQRKAIVEMLRGELRRGDVVLLKGSLSREVWKVLEELGEAR